MRVLVLGGSGFIGRHVTRRLAETGHEVMVFARGQTEAGLPPAVRVLSGDRADLAGSRGALRGAAPDVVIDMGAMTEANAHAVVATFDGVASRLVVISSADVYLAYGRLRGTEPGDILDPPFDEDAPLRAKLYPYRGTSIPGGSYFAIDDYDKVLVERSARGAAGLDTTVLRLPAVLGPDDRQRRLLPYLRRMDDGRPAIVLGETQARWQFTHGYVEDVADAIALAATDERARGRTYNVGPLETLTLSGLIQRLASAAGWDGRVVSVPDEVLPSPPVDFHQHLVTDTARIRRELGYSERTGLDEGLRRTVEWERADPPAPADTPSFDYAAEDALLDRYAS